MIEWNVTVNNFVGIANENVNFFYCIWIQICILFVYSFYIVY